MGLFDKLFKSNANSFTYTPKNEQEAWIAIMYGCVAIDGEVSEVEINKLCNLVVYKSMFKNHQLVDYYKSAMAAHKQSNSKVLIDSAAPKINADNKPTLFSLILELILADGILGEKEKEIMEYVAVSLNLDPVMAQTIAEVMLIKNKGNVVLV